MCVRERERARDRDICSYMHNTDIITLLLKGERERVCVCVRERERARERNMCM